MDRSRAGTVPRVAAGELDLNLLRVLEAVLGERSVTRAAERLHLSQPAVSHALARVRRALDDPILVREGRGLVLTPEGRRLAVEVPEIMRRIRTQITPGDADPAATTRRFVVALPDVLVSVIGPQLRVRLAASAPAASMELQRLTTATGSALMDGSIDAAIGVAGSWGDPLRSTSVATVSWRPVVADHHPAVGRSLSLEELARLPHVDVADHFVNDVVDAALSAQGLQRRVALVVMSAPVMLDLLPGSELVGFLPSVVRLDAGLRWLDIPDDIAISTYQLWWGHGADRDPLGVWFRRQVLSVSRTLRSTMGDRTTTGAR